MSYLTNKKVRGTIVSIGLILLFFPLHTVIGGCTGAICTLDETRTPIEEAPQVGDLFTQQITLIQAIDFSMWNTHPLPNSDYPLAILVGDFGVPAIPGDSSTWSDVITLDALAGDPPLLVSKLTLYSLDSTPLPTSVLALINTLADPINAAQQNLLAISEDSNGVANIRFTGNPTLLLDLTLISPEAVAVAVPEPATWALLGTLLLSAGLLKRRLEHVNQG